MLLVYGRRNFNESYSIFLSFLSLFFSNYSDVTKKRAKNGVKIIVDTAYLCLIECVNVIKSFFFFGWHSVK